MTDMEKEIVGEVINTLNLELKYGSLDEVLVQDLEYCVNSLTELLK